MMKSSTLRCSFGSIHWSGLKLPPLPSPRGTKLAIWQAMSLTSNSVTRRAPLLPSRRAFQVASTPHASGVTRPKPVITRSRIKSPAIVLCEAPGGAHVGAARTSGASRADQPRSTSGGFCLLLQELDGIADSLDLLGGVVRDLTTELFL